MELKLNKTETKRLLKVKESLEDMFNNGKLKKYGIVSSFVAREIATSRLKNLLIETD